MCCGLSGSFGEPHGHRIHAIAESRGARPIVEDVPEMRIAEPAGDRHPHHPQTAVGCFHDVFFRYRRPKARPASSRFKFRVGVKQRRVATNAAKYSLRMIVRILVGIRALGARVARNFKGGGRKLLPPFLFRFRNSIDGDRRFSLAIVGKLDNLDCLWQSRRCSLRVNRLMPLGVDPCEHHARRNGANQLSFGPGRPGGRT